MSEFKKKLSLILVVIMCLSMLPLTASAESGVDTLSASDYAFDENEIVFTFANLSDPHIGFGDNANV